MKTRVILSLLIAISMMATSCLTGNDNNSNTAQIASSGTWRVSFFSDSGNDETSNYSGYSFAFSDGGTITVTKNGSVKTGIWSVSNSSKKFNIDLGAKTSGNPLGELSDDWRIISSSETVITLGDDNASSNEFLTFTKN